MRLTIQNMPIARAAPAGTRKYQFQERDANALPNTAQDRIKPATIEEDIRADTFIRSWGSKRSDKIRIIGPQSMDCMYPFNPQMQVRPKEETVWDIRRLRKPVAVMAAEINTKGGVLSPKNPLTSCPRA